MTAVPVRGSCSPLKINPSGGSCRFAMTQNAPRSRHDKGVGRLQNGCSPPSHPPSLPWVWLPRSRLRAASFYPRPFPPRRSAGHGESTVTTPASGERETASREFRNVGIFLTDTRPAPADNGNPLEPRPPSLGCGSSKKPPSGGFFFYFFSKPRTSAARSRPACMRSEKSEPESTSCTPIAMWRSRSSAVYRPPMPGNLPCLRQAATTRR